MAKPAPQRFLSHPLGPAVLIALAAGLWTWGAWPGVLPDAFANHGGVGGDACTRNLGPDQAPVAVTLCHRLNDTTNGFDPSNLLGLAIASRGQTFNAFVLTIKHSEICTKDSGGVFPNCPTTNEEVADPASGQWPTTVLLFKNLDPGAVTNTMFGQVRDNCPGPPEGPCLARILVQDPFAPLSSIRQNVESDPGTEHFKPCAQNLRIPFVLVSSGTLGSVNCLEEVLLDPSGTGNHIGPFTNPSAEAALEGSAFGAVRPLLTDSGGTVSRDRFLESQSQNMVTGWRREFTNDFGYTPIAGGRIRFDPLTSQTGLASFVLNLPSRPDGPFTANAVTITSFRLDPPADFANTMDCGVGTATVGRLCARWRILEQDPEAGGQELTRQANPTDFSCHNNSGVVLAGNNVKRPDSVCPATEVPFNEMMLSWRLDHNNKGSNDLFAFTGGTLRQANIQGDFILIIDNPAGLEPLPVPVQNPPIPYPDVNGNTVYPCLSVDDPDSGNDREDLVPGIRGNAFPSTTGGTVTPCGSNQ